MTNTQLRAAARAWLQDDPDPVTRAELQSTLEADDLHSLREGFAARLQFGTAGLRGVLGPGPGRMNRKLVREVTRGVADALLARDPAIRERGVVVGADARRLSPELAEDTARVFAGAGIRVHRAEFLLQPGNDRGGRGRGRDRDGQPQSARIQRL